LLERLSAPPPPLPALGPQAERLRLFDQVTGFLRRLSQQAPLLLFLDDLHWADAASLELLEHVLQRVGETQVLLLGTYRRGDVGPEHPLREVRRRVQRTERTLTLELPPLDAAEVKHLVQVLLGGQEISPALADTIYRETEGNPLFVEEILNALLEGGEIRLTPTGWERWRKGVLVVPGSIQAVLGRRLDRLSEDCRHALIQASAMGQEFDFDVLKALVRLDDEGLLDLLDEALEARLVDEVPIGEGEVYRFRHAMIARVLYERTSSRRQALLHRRIGRIIESLYARDLAAHADELAYHFFRGVRGEQGREEALRYSLLAAERAEAVYANQEAVRHYRRVLGLLQGERQGAQRLQVLEQLADVYATLEPREALPLYEQALALWREIDGDRITGVRLHRKLAELATDWAIVLDLPHDRERTQVLVEAGLELLRDEPRSIERLRLLLIWAGIAPDAEAAWQRAEEAMGLAEQLGATDALAEALDYLEWIHRDRGELRQARDLLCSHLEEIEQKASLQTRAEAHRTLGQVLGFLGEYPQAIEYLKLSRQEYEQAGHVLLTGSAQFFVAYFYMQWDRWPEAYQSGVETIEMRRKHGLGPWRVPLLLARMHALWGDAEGAERRRLEALEEKDEFQPRVASYLSAQISMAQEDFTAAQRIFEDTLSWVPPDHQVRDHLVYPYLAECAARAGDEATALHYATLAEEVARRGGSKPWLALALRAQALVYTERKEWKQAGVRLEEALVLFRGMGCRWEEGRTLVDLAHLYRWRGESGDRERAWQHYQEALNRFEELWAQPDVERVQREMMDL
jgi:tetratricopeptide (TPR) repeat protein